MSSHGLRHAATVLDPADLGGAWPDRHSFVRTMIRRASDRGWRVSALQAEANSAGEGSFSYRVEAEGHIFTFLASTRSLDEADRIDRVVAKNWEITAALVEGELRPEHEAALRRQIPLQERARLDSSVLVLTRANRSARFFEQVADTLAAGEQPDLDALGPTPYLIRSTAFYSNGKFGMRQFGDIAPDHPLSAPYRAQMLAAWLLRELGIDLVEAVARARACERHTVAARLHPAASCRLGLGNATGLGMVPIVVNHPDFLDAWVRVREVPLAHILRQENAPGDPQLALLDAQLDRARRFLAAEKGLGTAPFTAPDVIADGVQRLHRHLGSFREGQSAPRHILAELHDEATAFDPALRGLLASALVEVHPELDELAEGQFRCRSLGQFDPTEAVGSMLGRLKERYDWALSIDFESAEETHFAWVASVDNEEPRRVERSSLGPADVEHWTDVARRVSALARDLAAGDPEEPLARFLARFPMHRCAVTRVAATAHLAYGELRDNLVGVHHLPLNTQRFQLATYGMHHYSPQSTNWLRVALLCGAPRVGRLQDGDRLDVPLFPLATDHEEVS